MHYSHTHSKEGNLKLSCMLTNLHVKIGGSQNKQKDMDVRKGLGGEGLQRLIRQGNGLLKHY